MSSKLTTTEAFNMNLKISANKIFPEKWKMKFPVAMSQSQSTNTPKYFPGSDILAGDDPDDSLKVITKRQSINTSLSRSGNKNDPFLTRLLVNPVSASFNASHSQNSSLEIASKENTTLAGKVAYSLSIPKGKGIPYLSWIPFLNEKTKGQKFYLMPTSFKWSMNVSKKEEDRISRSTMDTSSTYSFGMSKNMNISYTPFDPMKITYQRSSSSDLFDYQNDILGIFSNITYDSLMNGVNVGNVTSMRENVAITYNPILAEWLKPRLSYNSNYNFRAQKDQYYASVGVTRKYSIAVTLSLKQVWDTYAKKIKAMNKKREKMKAPENKPKKLEEREIVPKGADEDEPLDIEQGSKRKQIPKKKTQDKPTRKIAKKKITVSDLLGKINPIRFNYTDNLAKTNSGITGSDTIKIYKLETNFTYL